MENINKNITNEFCSMERKGTVLLSNMSIKKIDNANSCTLNEPLEENTLNYESNNNCSNSNLSKDKEKDRNILCNKYYSDEETNSLNKMYTSNIPEISNYYKEIQAINYILSNINNPNFLNSLELNDLINIEKKFINENIYINKQIIACNVKNEKSNDEMVEKNERKKKTKKMKMVLFMIAVILNVLLSNVYCFFEIKLTIILLNFFISNNCQWSFSLFPLSLINKLIHKFSLKINKKVPKYKLENMNINSPNIPYTYLFICDGIIYIIIVIITIKIIL
ncbi:hypothetical protein PFTANZ_03465 [Plasmodium falciparum Tanzania (2000708)]|uniref:Uncharacterized protein n=1 Tax=Plasmodium falciparum Tanzania (2000708) TaxID=1036725 RepID=A0A024W5C4_PLAFA|nr:hypothetical protein PFTANZ_03465 [Plasmodium falciparum Tanzania (2000708)]